MKLIVCLDETGGMSWGKRRQSRDTEVIKRIKETANPLYINEYSLDLFPEAIVGTGEGFYFAEVDLPESNPEEIYIFYWNRLYPSDFVFNIDLGNYNLVSAEDFRGNSHDKITLCRYRRK